MEVTTKARVPGYNQDVWFSTEAITDIMSLKNMKKQYRITYDSAASYDFIVHHQKFGKLDLYFVMHESGLHYYDPREPQQHSFAISTFRGNMEGYSQRQLKGVAAAKNLYQTLSYPSEQAFRWIIMANKIGRCKVTLEDVNNYFRIYGKAVEVLKGKTVRKTPAAVNRGDLVSVPSEILKMHRDVTLRVDIFFLNQIPFLYSKSKNICFRMVCHLSDRKASTISKELTKMVQFYAARNFRVSDIDADGEFAPVQVVIHATVQGPRMNLTAADEHVPEIERDIRFCKERSRCLRHSMPFVRIPVLLTVHIVFCSVRNINFFPAKGGISQNLSPRTLMTGETLDYYKHLQFQTGEYGQAHRSSNLRNGMPSRTVAAIYLGPSGNIQGGHVLLNLVTGQKITENQFTPLPMPMSVIARVQELGKGQPELLTFTDRRGRLIGDMQRLKNTKWTNRKPLSQNLKLLIPYKNASKRLLRLKRVHKEMSCRRVK